MKRPSLQTGITIDQWRAWAEQSDRNFTDDPIGKATRSRRTTDAQNSQLVASIPRTKDAAA